MLQFSDKEEFKQVAESLTKLFTLLTTLGVAVKTSDHAGHEFFTKHYILIHALTLGIVAFFLVLVLHAVLQQQVSSNFFATLLLLVLGTVVSVLASSLISRTTALITLTLWAIVFILVIIFKFQELYKPFLDAVFERTKKWIGSFKPQFPTPKNVQKWFQSYWQQSTLFHV